MVQVGGARAVRPCVVLAAVGRLLVLLLLLKLARELGEALLVLGEDRVDWEVDVAVGAYAAELLGDVVDYWLAAVVEIRLAKVPLLAVADHRVQLVHGGDEGKLGILKDLGISAKNCVSRWASLGHGGVQIGLPSRQLLKFRLLSCACCAYEAVVLASLTWEFPVTLVAVSGPTLTGHADQCLRIAV